MAAATAVLSGVGRVAVATSPTDVVRPSVHIPAADTPVELRGAGRSSRQVHNFGTPQALDAARLIVCEVITPAENWSSYPPHKHDTHRDGETNHAELYHYRYNPPTGFGGQFRVPLHHGVDGGARVEQCGRQPDVLDHGQARRLQ